MKSMKLYISPLIKPFLWKKCFWPTTTLNQKCRKRISTMEKSYYDRTLTGFGKRNKLISDTKFILLTANFGYFSSFWTTINQSIDFKYFCCNNLITILFILCPCDPSSVLTLKKIVCLEFIKYLLQRRYT